jgi:cyclase
VKSVKFKDYRYVGDPINAVRIFNEKEVDELCILDITATQQKRSPDLQHISEIVSEAFMPIAYGGGINSLNDVEKLFFNGIEKIVLNYAAIHNKELITEIAKRYGQQSVVVSIDYKSSLLGKQVVYTLNGSESVKKNPVEFAKDAESLGAGEILLNSIERDGTFSGYDLKTIEKVSAAITIPLIACGGAGSIDDFKAAAHAGASAVAAGSLFVFHGKHRAVLITYPSPEEIKTIYTN